MSALEPVFGPGTHLVIQPTEAQEHAMRQAAAGFSRRCGDRRKLHSRRRAYNLLELLVVMLIIGTICTITFAQLNRALPTAKLRGKAAEVSSFLQRARLASIKAGLDVSVEVESNSGTDTTQFLVAYVLRPDGTYQIRKVNGVDFRVSMATMEIGSPDRPGNVHLKGSLYGSPKAAIANSFTASKLVYKPTGMAANQGALRFSIGTGERQNTIEVAVQDLGGQPVLRKYIKPGDRPSGTPSDVEFLEASHYGTKWQWKWY
jgi:type II secretory pathway pseudopilin PulG